VVVVQVQAAFLAIQTVKTGVWPCRHRQQPRRERSSAPPRHRGGNGSPPALDPQAADRTASR